LHVVLLSHEYPPFIFGGIGTFVKNLAHGLQKKGIKVTVISGYPKKWFKKNNITNIHRKDAGINVIRLPYLNMPPRHTVFQLANFKQIYKIIEEIDGDVVHGQSGSSFPIIINLKKSLPTVVTFHTNPELELIMSLYSLTRGGSIADFYTYVLGYPIWKYSFTKEIENSNVVVAVSKILKKQLLSTIGKKNEEKIKFIYNGIDIETLEKEYSNICYEKEKRDPTVFFAGRLFWRKGVLSLIKLAYVLKKCNLNLKIIVHGSGPLHRKMKERIRYYRLNNIILKGFTKRIEFMKDLKRAICVVIPSFYEVCPMMLLESMCLGKIPIMFDLPYAQEFTKNGEYGVLAKNIKDMAFKIKMIYEHDDMKYFGNKIRNYARKKHDIIKVAREYYKIYKEAA